jgi:SAM-dependent methyltransferase
MGLTASNLRLVAQELNRRGVSGGRALIYSVLGVQGSLQEVRDLLARDGYPVRDLAHHEVQLDSLTQFGTSLHVSTLFRMLGYDRVETVDLFPDEGPDIIADLNSPFPPNLCDSYDLVFDSGTTEHCFHVKQVLENALRALKVGGVVMHILPMSGFAGHGFYQFSPELFSGFYGSNGFAEIALKVELRIGSRAYYFDFDPDSPLPGDFWGIPAQLFFSARKVSKVEQVRLPNQRVFDLPLDHALRSGEQYTTLQRIAKRILPDVLKKYLLRRRFFSRVELHLL